MRRHRRCRAGDDRDTANGPPSSFARGVRQVLVVLSVVLGTAFMPPMSLAVPGESGSTVDVLPAVIPAVSATDCAGVLRALGGVARSTCSAVSRLLKAQGCLRHFPTHEDRACARWWGTVALADRSGRLGTRRGGRLDPASAAPRWVTTGRTRDQERKSLVS